MSPLARPLKFLTGWSSHLFYWVYPGVMIALLTTLVDYLLRQFGSEPTVFGKLILAGAIAAFIGFLALRGITGSMTSSVLLNVVQISVVVIFCGTALAFRLINPLELPPQAWIYQQASAIFMPVSLEGLLVQASAAIFLVLGFESVVSLGVTSTNPRGDLPRGVILALLIQGLVAYSFQYFAFSYALTAQAGFQPDHPSPAPLGDMAVLIGDHLLSGNGYTLMLVVAASVIIACLAAALTSMNTGVRTTFSMAMDAEMPEFLGLLHGKYATPYAAVIILATVSTVIALVGTLGGQIMLAGLILAANLGAFCLYALVCMMAMVTSRNLRGRLLGGMGLFVNLGLAGVIIWSALFTGGAASLAGRIALTLALIWLVISGAYYFVRRWRAS